MKGFASLALIVYGIAMVGCQSPSVPNADSTPKTEVTTPNSAPPPPKPVTAIGYDWRDENWGSQDFSIVELTQGSAEASTLKVCHLTFWATTEKLSNRKSDECDRIAAKGLAIQRRRDAEEKRKDDAYDKAHPKK